MRKSRNKKSRPSLSQKARLRKKAQRRREIERLEERQMLSVNFADDPLFQDQWHLRANGQLVEQPDSPTFLQSQARLDINVLGAWDLGYTGSGVQVAVVDSGFDLDHPDLQFFTSIFDTSGGDPNAVTFLDVLDLDNDPTFLSTTDSHGTSVAGIIGALDNTTGGVGVSPGADLVPIRLLVGDGDIPTGTPTAEQAAYLEFLQFAGVPQPGEDGLDTTNVVDVYNRSYGPNEDIFGRTAVPLTPQDFEALRTAATLGRGSWLDHDGDGVFEVEEIRSLGAINVKSAGNSAGPGTVFGDIGIYDSSQYDGLANSRYTITVGSVDFEGNYINPVTGTRGSYAETGANVLLVAPSQTAGIGIGLDRTLIGGLTTTDLAGEDGSNGSPVFGLEVDGDFLADIDYTSTFGGTSGATPQVSGAIALMLEANPKLSYRDVQQILLMSAEQIDIFDETWVVNAYQYFEDAYVAPSYNYRDFDTNLDGTPDVRNGVIPSFLDDSGDLFVLDEMGNLRELPVDNTLPTVSFNDITQSIGAGVTSVPPLLDAQGMPVADSPVYVYGANRPTVVNTQGILDLLTPVSGQNKYISDDTTTNALTTLVNNELKFETGSGFTVSWGYGDQFEEYGYAHGSLDTELAVRLAEAWETYDLYLDNEVTISTGLIGGVGSTIRVQPSADIDLPQRVDDFVVPGGISTVDINNAYYSEFFRSYNFTNLTLDGTPVGSVITDGPFYDPNGSRASGLVNRRGDSRLAIPIDTSVTTDFLSVEWVEFTAQLDSGDINELRVSLVSPDGTQTELNPYRIGTGNVETYQVPQVQQSGQTGGDEVLDDVIGRDIIVSDGINTAFIDGQEDPQIAGVALNDTPLSSGDFWTWTTNRHWGELLSTEAQNNDIPGATVDGQWYLVFENWGSSEVRFNSNYEVAFHGVEATGNRIQGKIGVDDNAQGREDQDNDQLFNFDRNITFGEASLTTLSTSSTIQLVLDDATDSVHYANNYYETVDESTGEVFRYAVVDQFEYFALAEILKGAAGQDFTTSFNANLLTGGRTGAFSEAEVQEWYDVYGVHFGFDPNPVDEDDGMGGVIHPIIGTDPMGNPIFDTTRSILSEQDILFWRDELLPMITDDIATAEAFEPQLNYDIASGVVDLLPRTDSAGNTFNYQNFDYNQETFASNVVVQATQYVVNYDPITRMPLPRVATGNVDRFTTGADGNYWFDVEANPKPPELADFPTQAAFEASFDQWFLDFGKVYEYEISLDGDSAFTDRIIDKDYSSDVNFLKEASGFSSAIVERGDGSIDYQAGQLKYNVPIWASPDIHNGQTTVLKDVNFLLEVDPAKTNVVVSGSVYRDQDSDDVFDTSEMGIAGAVVYHDADGNGMLDMGEASGVVDANGNYAFTISGITSQQAVTIAVDESSLPSTPVVLEFLNPQTGAQSIDVTPGFGVDVDFTLQRMGGEPALIQGTVFEDANQNAMFDTNEFGLGISNQVTVYIDINGDGVFDNGTEPSAQTLSDGTFAIESDVGGLFNVRIDLDNTPLTLSTPSSNAIPVDVVVGQAVSDLLFGMFDSRTQDFGDLQGYPTLLSENGARHVVMPGVFLGARVDIDDDGMPTANARGDDSTGVNDEDGVVLLDDIAANADFDLEITPHGQGASLNAWIDFNNDGDWDDAGEQIFVDQGLILDQKNTLTVTAPADVDPTATALAARFRWGPFGISYDGPANAGEVEDYLLPTEAPVNISGNVRNDVNGDGVFDVTDTPVENVVVYYDANLDGIRQVDEISSITDADGAYQLPISTAVPIAITLRIDESSLQNDEQFISPIDGIFSQTVTPGVPETANFLVGFPQGVQGNVFADDDNNGLKTGAESGFANIPVSIYADTDNDTVFESLVTTILTDAMGNYNIPVSVADTYELRIDISSLEFHEQSTPSTPGQEVVVSAGMVSTAADFGVYNAALDFTADFGDLSGIGFPTTAAENGASHLVVSGIFLGSTVDADPGTLTSSDAMADDNSLADDEDGVVLVSDQIVTDSTLELDITATGTGVVMNAWIDFNNDGDWDDTGEQILLDRGLTSGVTTRVVIDTTGIEVAPSETELAARFRWGSAGIGYSGADTLGEVEDYLLPTSTLPPSPADFTGDGVVDQADHDLWVSSYGSTTDLRADGNNDGVVDIADYTVWRDAMEAPAAAMTPVPPADETIYVTPVTYEPSAAAASFAPLTASPEESLELEAAVLMGGSQDESFAIESALASEGPVQEGSVDEALLLIDGSILSENEETEFSTFDSEEQEDEEALLEALSSF